ncbi:competence protein ComEC family protein [Polaribacter sp. MSW13]|uniref:Competence protein ComEC family protein n=1 Tax=Polaribacter marinus TaxID=2916838 RepID=A0A9X1VMY4_9FLAO|nr:ComEC/Rec2 family competence protein [Polaribacter marinus]MCI2228993.1 competence protein ComEC family protein [Polaribacter marinus]
MKRLFNYLPMHFLVLLVLGIIIQYYTGFWQLKFVETFIVFLILMISLYTFKNKVLRTILSFLIFFLLGVFTTFTNDDRNYSNYYQYHLQDKSAIILRIKKILKPGNYYYKYEADVVKVDEKKTKGSVLLNIKKDSLFNGVEVDYQIYLCTKLKELIPPLNPHQFNYKSYLSKQGIHHQIFIDRSQFLKLKSVSFSLLGFSAKFRSAVQKSLKKYSFSNDVLAVINALLLGQRQDISKELIEDYSRAGGIHILAVSGLHVGVLLSILSFLFKPLENFKKGKVFKTIFVVLSLWMFAFVAGLSASVVRAVTMFTFLAVGQSLQRKNVVFFSLISSMLFLLILKPMFLFDVGFQLSYLAVFGIVWIQPKLYAIWKIKLKGFDFFWKLFTVSIAAQVGVLLLSIYYFHQFPGLFFVSNLVIIPFLGIILGCGIGVIILAIFNILPSFLANIYATIISWMNAFVSWISHQENFLFKELYLSFLMMITCYVFMFLGLQFIIKKRAKILQYFLLSIVFVQVVFLLEKRQNKIKKEFVVFHKSRKSIIGNRLGNSLFLAHSRDSLLIKENSIQQYKLVEGIREVKVIDFKNILKFNDATIVLVDSLGVYKLENLIKPIVVLQYSPKINLRRLIKKLQPTIIIADGSNYKSYINRWKLIGKDEGLPFHYTGEKGAFVLRE